MLPAPGGPSIVDVEQRQYSNGIQQVISLAGTSTVPGQNYIRVQLFGIMDAKVQSSLPERSIALDNIASEMRAAFPTVRMARSPYYVQNRYGPFGYAIGRGGSSALCLYGWQRIHADASLFADRGAIDIRVRVCDAGTTENQLLSIMYNYAINAFGSNGSWNPYGDAPSPPENFGKGGADILPNGPGGMGMVLSSAPAAPRTVAVRRRAPVARPAPAAAKSVDEAPTGPVVPAPPNAGASPVIPPPAVPAPPAAQVEPAK